jgi:ribonuclease HI
LSLELLIHTDGACSGNPGPAGIGVVIEQDGKKIWEISKAIGPATNNIAEYTALIFGLQQALVLKASKVIVITDSELMCEQVKGSYKVKNDKIKLLHEQVKQLVGGFCSFEIKHVLREQNKDADRLASEAIKKTNQNGCLSV